MVSVSTKQALAQAKSNNESEIIVVGPLADKLKTSKKVARLGVVSLVGLVGAVGVATLSAPETAGLSIIASAPVIAGWGGLEVSAVIIAASLGLSLIIAISKNYEEISYEKGQLVLRKKVK